jgi:hypothetical protein
VSAGDAIAEEVRGLSALDLEGLRAEWRRRYGPPPALRSHDLLRRNLAWRIQAAAYGAIDTELRRRLTQRTEIGPRLPVGARLAREWRGRRYEVERTANGFRFEDRSYTSLSQVACEITGVRWNGPRFFGLRSEAAT